ncbi:leucine-rich repeat receptor-like tyrosine-protein kinase PXC3 [Impatiens glandulifera]|uniref:leucine-rich repeat receptor-like tyrosine-protein kinase PXC3 n=1 Tax=Impatiens glandulifera TaxID=253017 RepID=UPI001FB18D46|nr:leucine-rich repeat receptor-like tyrosine-protein kinase PXC3 [Impatiens glandulifera]
MIPVSVNYVFFIQNTKMKDHTFHHLLIIFFFFPFILLVVSELDPNQRTAIINLYNLLQNNTTSSSSSLSWNITEDPNPCVWEGIQCNSNASSSSIIQISLDSLSLSTLTIFPILCNIDTLESLNVSNNQFNSIPDGFMSACGNLTGLKRLDFSRNRVSGNFPDFRGFPALEFLDLSFNFLTGPIDSQLAGLNNLRSLNLSYNRLKGLIPTQISKSLEHLQLFANLFSGEIPHAISDHTNLVLIDLAVNDLSGSIPANFSGLSKLEILILSDNNLTGEIPPSISNLRSLSRFAANQNRISGSIPSGITRFVKNLDLSYNKLTGLLPDDLLSYPNLQYLDLSYNTLQGPLPTNVSNQIVRLRLGNNLFNGKIPSWNFENLVNLTYLELDGNRLTGSIPPGLGLCRSLALLNLARNELSGSLPFQLGGLGNLQELKLQDNGIVGEIPIQITELPGLRKLNISCNFLNGSIPSSISSLLSLTNLDLRENGLSGLIPDSIAKLNSLLELQLGRNRLTGKIPQLPQNLQIALNLSANLFDGEIPFTIYRLINLEVLDLSNNRFSGEIPDSITGMISLTQLILSNNRLTGVLPSFRQHINIDTTGNSIITRTPDSSYPRFHKKKNISIGIAVGLVAAVVAIASVFLIAVSIVSKRVKRIKDDNTSCDEENNDNNASQIILTSSNGVHRSTIDFDTAMEAILNPANLVTRTRFSTYYKAVMPSGITYFVKKLNWSDKIFQLGSHEKFDQELEIFGRISNSNIMTPLAYVLMADSAYVFYEYAEKGTLFDVMHGVSKEELDWGSRYSIAIGVAQGLSYLHGCCPTGPVLLLDLSSKTIMLRSLKEPQVGDIELCKVIDPSKSTGSLSMVAGSVGYIPPEYAYTMRITMAGNIYSFGVILLELVTGKPAVMDGVELAKLAINNSMNRDKLERLLDITASQTSVAVKNQMLAVLKIGLDCVNVSPKARPKAKSILRMLLNAR